MAGNNNPDLQELKRRWEALPKGEWRYTVSRAGRHQISAIGGGNICMMWSTFEHPAKETGPALCAIHNAFPDLLEHVRWLERERDELREESAYIQQQLEWVEDNGDTYTKESLLDFIRRTIHAIGHTAVIKEALAARDAQQRREGAAEAYEEMRKQAVEVGKQSGLAAKFCKIFADECIEQSAQRIREGK